MTNWHVYYEVSNGSGSGTVSGLKHPATDEADARDIAAFHSEAYGHAAVMRSEGDSLFADTVAHYRNGQEAR